MHPKEPTETQVFLRNQRILDGIVYSYLQTIPIPVKDCRQDFLQTAYTAFLLYLRKKDPDPAPEAYKPHIVYALKHHRETWSVLHMPHRAFIKLHKAFSQIPLEEEELPAEDCFANVECAMAYEQFWGLLDEKERTMVDLARRGVSKRQIARRLGLPEIQVYRAFYRMKKKFLAAFSAGEA